ncbi:cytochrome c biogenesis CcdA family protein [Streptomyces sp. NBC_01236]|uniref:cytochrome c biogenesis CcdA family protein n=1 Tax=Streptomyces sp. NBC_01236 TaxID=2903789 RepID=UPI002E112A0F|nr:cytochrome c biogenesis protein CcdA [Streptomyces sp. NBC_01236]
MSQLLFGTTLLASFFGGVVALLAPCCISVMLPAYFATGFRSRGRVVAGTLAFGAGVATVIVPIGLGAAAISAALLHYHLWVYLTGGALMLLGGLAVLYGWKPNLPMPSGRSPHGNGFGAAYALGAFSGIASACCAPVLAGVAVLSGATASFPAALSVGLVYVLGMVAPLVVIALAWERGHRGPARILQGRQVQLRLGTWKRRVALGDLLAGVLLVGMGILTAVLAITGPSMPTSGWRVTFAADLQHAASVATGWLAWVPGWAVAVLAAVALVLLIRRARRSAAHAEPADRSDTEPAPFPSGPASCAAATDRTRTMETSTDGR